MSNFDFILKNEIFKTFAEAAEEAEKSIAVANVSCTILCRRALELAVKWIYANDRELVLPYQNNLSSLVYDINFKSMINEKVFNGITYIIKLGNFSVHSNKKVTRKEAVLCLKYLFDFMDWIAYYYDSNYVETKFDEGKLPAESSANLKKEEREELENKLVEKDEKIEKILKENEDIEIVWFVKNIEKVKKEFPSRVRLVKIFSLRYLYELATAKVWVNNSRFDQFVIKRKGQYYIQTWHGGLALKKIEYDAADKMSEYYHKVMKNDNNLMDVMISNSKFCTEVYRRAFRFKGDIKEYGTPRNDFLLQKHDDTITKIRNFFDIKEDNKILLYAPTFRDKYLKNPYDIDFERVKKELEDKTKQKWKIIVKLHPRIENPEDLIKFNDDIINATKYPDVQELIYSCDLLITDYSSTMFESLIANKSVILYANDIENYINERGFYFTFEELPFLLSKNNEELIKIIRTNNLEEMKKGYEDFKKEVGLKENGDASKKVYEIIKEKIK